MRRVMRWAVVVTALAVTAGCGASTGAQGTPGTQEPAGTDGATPSGDVTVLPAEDGAADDGTGDDAQDGVTETEETAAPGDAVGGAGMPAGCGKRWVDPEEPIEGPLFAECTITATSIAQTAQYLNTDDLGQTAGGPVRLSDPFEAHFTYSAGIGAEMILTADAAWLSSPTGGWTLADPAGEPEQQIAHGITATAQALASRMVHEGFLASSPHWTPVDDDAEGTDGARAYSGTPDLGPATVQRYVIWIDGDHLPVRIEHTTTAFGVTVSVVEEFTDWGRPVEIAVPDE